MVISSRYASRERLGAIARVRREMSAGCRVFGGAFFFCGFLAAVFLSESSERFRARTRRDDRAVVAERIELMVCADLSRARSPSVALTRR